MAVLSEWEGRSLVSHVNHRKRVDGSFPLPSVTTRASPFTFLVGRIGLGRADKWRSVFTFCFVFIHDSSSVFSCLQVAKHPLHLQHGPGDPDLARLHRPLADGAQHLVLRGQPVLQVPVLLQGVQHHEILNLVPFPSLPPPPPPLVFSPSSMIAMHTLQLWPPERPPHPPRPAVRVRPTTAL